MKALNKLGRGNIIGMLVVLALTAVLLDYLNVLVPFDFLAVTQFTLTTEHAKFESASQITEVSGSGCMEYVTRDKAWAVGDTLDTIEYCVQSDSFIYIATDGIYKDFCAHKWSGGFLLSSECYEAVNDGVLPDPLERVEEFSNKYNVRPITIRNDIREWQRTDQKMTLDDWMRVRYDPFGYIFDGFVTFLKRIPIFCWLIGCEKTPTPDADVIIYKGDEDNLIGEYEEDEDLTDQDIVDTIGMDKVDDLADKYDTSEEFVMDATRKWAKCRSEGNCNEMYNVCDEVSLEEFIFSQTNPLGYYFYGKKCKPAPPEIPTWVWVIVAIVVAILLFRLINKHKSRKRKKRK